MIKFRHSGNFNKTETFLQRVTTRSYMDLLNKYGREGINALASNTPIDSGKTAQSWSYEIQQTQKGLKICWNNSNIVNGVPIAIIIQYGHGTRNGGYVQGRDYINPALRPIFDKIANEVWGEVMKS